MILACIWRYVAAGTSLAASLTLWALRGLCARQVRVFAKQLAKDGITVNAVIPVRIP